MLIYQNWLYTLLAESRVGIFVQKPTCTFDDKPYSSLIFQSLTCCF